MPADDDTDDFPAVPRGGNARRDDDDDRPRRPRAKRSGVPVWAWLLIAGFVMVPVMLGCVGIAVVTAIGNAHRQATNAPAGKKLYTRDEFQTLMLDKSPDEVRELLGKPDRTDVSPRGNEKWTYYGNITHDPKAKSKDSIVTLEFVGGRVRGINSL